MSELKYPWQRAVLDAFGQSTESLPIRINIAQRAIAARQMELPQPDAFERIAIREALQSLGKLIEETRAGRQIHFHIRWSGGKLDWERFDSRREAESSAQQLARPGETYTIEGQSEDCPRCQALMNQSAASG